MELHCFLPQGELLIFGYFHDQDTLSTIIGGFLIPLQCYNNYITSFVSTLLFNVSLVLESRCTCIYGMQ